jgi:hypothetical protein
VTEHIDRRRTLFRNETANPRLVFTILGFHVDECDLAMNLAKTFDLDSHRPANLAVLSVTRASYQRRQVKIFIKQI